MTPEDRLRAALDAAARPTPPTPEGADGVLAAAAHRRRRRATALSSLAVAVLLAVGGLTVLADDDASRVDTGPAQTTTVPTTPAPTTAVAVTTRGAVVVVDTAEGRTIGTLAPEGSADPTRKPVRTPDGRRVYFANQAYDCGWSDLFEVPTDGGRAPQPIAKGHAPAVSPDGTRLAYATADGCVGAELVVRSLVTGEETKWRYLDRIEDPFARGGISAIEWAPDSRRLAVQLDLEAMYVLDTGASKNLSDAKKVEPEGQPRDTMPASPAWGAADGRLALAASCCRNPDGMEAEQVRTSNRTYLVDVATNEATPLLEPGISAWSLDYDASGQWLLWVEADAGGTLVVRTPEGDLQRLGADFGAASW